MFLRMLDEGGAINTAHALLATSSPSDGFTRLWELERLDLAVEAIVLDAEFSSNFSEDELETARRRLGDYGYALPSSASPGLTDPQPRLMPTPAPATTTLPIHGSGEFIERVRAIAGRPERNMEDVVKELLVRLGHDSKRIVFQVGRIDVAVQDHTGRIGTVIEVKRSLATAPVRDDALRKGFDYAGRNGARFVVITDAVCYEIYDRTLGLDHSSMLFGKFRLTEFRETDEAAFDLLRPR